MKKFKIRRDDTVVVIAGKHKGKTGRVLRVLRDKDRVLVERVNLVKRHVRPTAERAGGIIEKEAPIHVSNVALWDAADARAMKVGWKTLDDGKKVRFDKKSGAVID